MTDRFSFSLSATSGKARAGVISTARGPIRTPAFMPVGTARHGEGYAARKRGRPTGADILLGNTYHLYAHARGRTGGASSAGFTSS